MSIIFNCQIMRKILVAILCLIFLGACTQKSELEQENAENSLELSVRSGESVVSGDIPVFVYDLTKSNSYYEPVSFAPGEKITFTDLVAGEYTYFVLGGEVADGVCSLYSSEENANLLSLEWHDGEVPELLGGIVKVEGSNDVETVEMSRMVGGLEINVVNKGELRYLSVSLSSVEQDSIALNGYTIIPRQFYLSDFEEGKMIYHFPTKSPVKGTIHASDDWWNTYFFDFESTKCIERNKKLELRVTLDSVAFLGRSSGVKKAIVSEENISDL